MKEQTKNILELELIAEEQAECKARAVELLRLLTGKRNKITHEAKKLDVQLSAVTELRQKVFDAHGKLDGYALDEVKLEIAKLGF